MIIRLVMLGTGGEFDPFRADLPNHSVMTTDQVNMTITVSAASRVSPRAVPPPGTMYWSTENGVSILVGMPEDLVMAWWAQLAAMYPSRQPPYQPGFEQ